MGVNGHPRPTRNGSLLNRACLQRFGRWQSFCVELERVREERVGFARQRRHSNRGAALCYVIVSRRLEEPVWPVDVLGAQPASPPDPGPTGSSLQGGERESSRPDRGGSILGPRTRECKSRTCLQLDPNLAEEASPVPIIMLPFQGFFNRAEVGKVLWKRLSLHSSKLGHAIPCSHSRLCNSDRGWKSPGILSPPLVSYNTKTKILAQYQDGHNWNTPIMLRWQYSHNTEMGLTRILM